MAYIRKWRRYHTEVNLIAQPSDDEDVSNNRHQMFTQNRHPTPENVSDAESNFSDHSNDLQVHLFLRNLNVILMLIMFQM